MSQRDYHRDYMRKRYQTDPLHRAKQQARSAVGHALRDGRLKRGRCESCGKRRAEAHHDDYEKPLEVRWLCRGCHKARHRAA